MPPRVCKAGVEEPAACRTNAARKIFRCDPRAVRKKQVNPNSALLYALSEAKKLINETKNTPLHAHSENETFR